MKLLETRGYRCTRSAASLGVWDIVGIGSRDVVLVQVKSNRKPRSEEMKTLWSFDVPPGVRKILHVWVDGESNPMETDL